MQLSIIRVYNLHTMYVCLCHAVKDTEIIAAVCRGCEDLDAIGEMLGVGTSCEICRAEAQSIIDSVAKNSPRTEYASRLELNADDYTCTMQQAANM